MIHLRDRSTTYDCAQAIHDSKTIPANGSARKRHLAVIEWEGKGTLGDWITTNRDVFQDYMSTRGAVLFRKFPPVTINSFQQAAPLLCGELVTENPEHTPVSADGSVQTPVPYAAERMLLWHNENSFNHEWPMRIAFCCLRPAEAGGETPIVDSCLVCREIDSSVRSRFVNKAIAYVRHFAAGVGVDWKAVFHTNDRAVVDEYCHRHQLLPEWKGQELVRTTAIRPAVVVHPQTGDLSWFNQAQHWHPACLDPDVLDVLQRSVGEAGLPRNCTFGDGTPIPEADMRHILDVYRRNQVVFPWAQGDVLVLDNVMWAHGRNPYEGRRTMLVALGSVHHYAMEGSS